MFFISYVLRLLQVIQDIILGFSMEIRGARSPNGGTGAFLRCGMFL